MSKENEVIFVDQEEEKIEESSYKDLQKITSYSVSNPVQTLIQKINDNEINLQPEFQRDFVWDIKRASLFIDSLIIGLPTPSLFLGKKKEDENFIVIDGQQRLKSIYYFSKGIFIKEEKEIPFLLSGLKDDRDWNNKTYLDLDDKLKKRINNAVLNTIIIEDINSQPQVVHDLFSRLNTGGMSLTDQEVRNCVYEGTFNNMIIKLNHNNSWRILLGTEHPDKRLWDVELILRFFALYKNLNNYKPSMRNFLSSYMESNTNIESNKNIFENLFVEVVSLILNKIGKEAFSIKSRAVNKSVCDSVMVSLAQLINQKIIPNNILENYYKLIKDENYLNYISSGTSGAINVKGRIDLARKYFLGEL